MAVAVGLLIMGIVGGLWDVVDPVEAPDAPVAEAGSSRPGVLPAAQWAHLLHMVLGGVGLVLVLFRRAGATRRYVLLAGVILLVWALMRFIFEAPVAASLYGWTYSGWWHLGVAAVVATVGFGLRSKRPRRSPESLEELARD